MKKKTVLVADDIYANQFLLASILEEMDCNIRMVSNGKEVFEALKKDKIDVIFMDIEMPFMNGLEATKLLKSNPETKKIPVVALTAHNLEDFAGEFENAGFDSILEKPYSTDRINEVLSAFNFD